MLDTDRTAHHLGALWAPPLRNNGLHDSLRWSEPDSNLGSPQATYPGLHPARGISVAAACPSHSPSLGQRLRGRAPLTAIAQSLALPEENNLAPAARHARVDQVAL